MERRTDAPVERRTDTRKSPQKVFEEALYAPLFPPWKSIILERDSLLDYRQRPLSPNPSIAELYHENSKLFPEMLPELTATHSRPDELRREFLRRQARAVPDDPVAPADAHLPPRWSDLLQGISRATDPELFYAVELRLVAGGSLALFEPIGCRLSVIKELTARDQEALAGALRLMEPPVLAAEGPVLFLLGCFARNELLFGARGYRRTLLEAGRVLIPGHPTEASGTPGVFAPIPMVRPLPGARRIPLPPAETLGRSLSETILQRRTRRDFRGEAISLGQLSTLLEHGCGTTGFCEAYGYSRLPLRTFPSSGGLQAPEVYLSVQAVGGVPAGLYHYHPIDSVLESLKPGNHGPALRRAALDQPCVEAAAVVFVITGYYQRVRWKYGDRGYRYMCMDAGFLGENLYLASEALGLGACAIAGFLDDPVNVLLDLDGQNEMVLLLLAVGVPGS